MYSPAFALSLLLLLTGISACDPSPFSLEDTGLYEELPTETLAVGVESYEPRFPQWSDGEQIRRWVYLPQDAAQIDTTDMDTWLFPEGVRFWKELSRNGVKLETRFLWKTGPEPEDWAFATYLWNEAQTTATKAYFFGMEKVLDTQHDIPSRKDCLVCHGIESTRPLGFSAIQLEHDPYYDGGQSLDRLIAEDRLTNPPEERLELPGDDLSQAALGYLHGNCGHCHSSTNRTLSPYVDLLLNLRTEDLDAVETTLAYRTAVDAMVTHGPIDGQDTVISPGAPDASVLLLRASRRGEAQMPPLATDDLDDTHLEILREWIASLNGLEPE